MKVLLFVAALGMAWVGSARAEAAQITPAFQIQVTPDKCAHEISRVSLDGQVACCSKGSGCAAPLAMTIIDPVKRDQRT